MYKAIYHRHYIKLTSLLTITYIFYYDKGVEKTEKVLNKEFLSLYEMFLENKL